MPKDKIKKVVGEYWKEIISGLVDSIVIVAFTRIHWIFKVIAFLIFLTDVVILIHSLVIQKSPKFLISNIIVNYLLRGASSR